jgi:segregation and condensation protein A
LSLIRDEQVDIYDIPIARIAEQFLARISTLGLDEAADYLEMAARLLRIKAQMLLPRADGEESWEDPRAELVRRLLEYQQMREVVDLLERRGEERRNQFARRWVPQSQPTWRRPTRRSCSRSPTCSRRSIACCASRRSPPCTTSCRAPSMWQGALLTIRSDRDAATRRWRDLIGRDAEPWQILSVLLALLEMAKLGEVRGAARSVRHVEIERRDAVSEAA